MKDAKRLALDSPIGELRGVGYSRLGLLKKLGLDTVSDLLYYAPRDYLDYSQIVKIKDLKPGKMTVVAYLQGSVRTWRTGRRQISEAILGDETSEVRAVWFNQPYRQHQLVNGRQYMISGEYGFGGGRYGFAQPSVERVESDRLSTGIVVAKYPETKGLNSQVIRRLQKQALATIDPKTEALPEGILQSRKLVGLYEALNSLHFPKDEAEGAKALRRLSFDELFSLQLASRLTRQSLKQYQAPKLSFDKTLTKKFVGGLPYQLTNSQRKSAWEIFQDLDKTSPMNRLLEGDVGSGKTVVAGMAVLQAKTAGYQSVLIAPTTILAEQHLVTLTKLLKPFVVSVSLLTSEVKANAKRDLQTKLKSGKVDLLISTNAVVKGDWQFKNLGLIVVDEQHRFGVKDREHLQKNTDGLHPHVLTMTATPIPRSLALTLYGELDLSIISELPVGRKPIKTTTYAHQARNSAYQILLQELDKSHQAYIVLPRIEDSGDGLPSLISYSKYMAETVLKNRKVGVLSGQMSGEEKDVVMRRFMSGEIQVLFATTVVEVGLDNPKATVMMVEAAERFGLAQLHQLRGRVGRSVLDSWCLLITSEGLEPTRRLNAMTQSTDGIKLAKLDLKMRGPGALYGLRQHGVLDLNFADITDIKFMKEISEAVDEWFKSDYAIKDYPLLQKRVKQFSRSTYLN